MQEKGESHVKERIDTLARKHRQTWERKLQATVWAALESRGCVEEEGCLSRCLL